MKKYIVGLFVGLAVVSQGAVVTWTGLGDGSSWTDGNNWDSSGAPQPADQMIINDATVNFNTTFTSTIANGDLSSTYAVIDLNGTAQLNLTGGSLTFQNGNANYSPIRYESGSVINISGGTHNLLGRLIPEPGTLRVTGSEATINLYQSGSWGTYDFVFDANGVSSLDYSSWANLGASTKLTVDGSAYSGGGSFVLLGSSNWTVDFQASNITITGLGAEGVGYTLDQSNGTGVTLTVVPEPATLGLVCGFGTLVVFVRRRFMI